MVFVLVLIILPVISIFLGVLEQIIFRRIFLIAVLNLLLWLLLTFTVFNRTFLIWAILNAVISTVSAYVARRWHRI